MIIIDRSEIKQKRKEVGNEERKKKKASV